MDEQNEFEERYGLSKEKKHELEKSARASTVKIGEVYEEAHGLARVTENELELKSFVNAWSQIMGTSIPFNVSTVETMLAFLSRLPMDIGMDIMSRSKFSNMQAMISAIRNKMIRDRTTKLRAAIPELFTPGVDDGKAK